MRLSKQQQVEGAVLAQKHSGLQARRLVQFARNKNTAMHTAFEWDNTICGDKYRLIQARQIINALVVVPEGYGKPVQLLVSLYDDRATNRGYRLLNDVLSDAQMRKQLLVEALAELQAFERKYGQLKELVAVFQAAKRVRARRRKKRLVKQ